MFRKRKVKVIEKKRPDVYAHRGAADDLPGSTYAAYEYSIKALKVQVIDMDVFLTKDGVLVIHHDPFLNKDRTRKRVNENWEYIQENILIKDCTYKDLQQYNIGTAAKNSVYERKHPNQKQLEYAQIPSLEEVIENTKSTNIRYQIELKYEIDHPSHFCAPKQIVLELFDVLKRTGIDTSRVEIQAFCWGLLKMVQDIDEGIKTAYLTSINKTKYLYEHPKTAGPWTGGDYCIDNYQNSHLFMMAKMGAKIWGPNFEELKFEEGELEVGHSLIREAHKYGLLVVPYTVNKCSDIIRMINIGVDGIITDNPKLVLELIRKHRVQGSKQEEGNSLGSEAKKEKMTGLEF